MRFRLWGVLLGVVSRTASANQSSMGSLLFLLLAFMPFSPSCYAEISSHQSDSVVSHSCRRQPLSSRKELRMNVENDLEVKQPGYSLQSNRVDPSRVVQLSWHPRVFLYEGFLTDQECEQLISLAHGKEAKLSAVDGELLKEVSPNINNNITVKIERRISAWTFLPSENGNTLQVEHHGLEDAEKKYDYFKDTTSSSGKEPVIAVVVLYLSNVSRGGEVIFPKSLFEDSPMRSDALSACAKNKPSVKPVKGNALLFFTRNLDFSPDDHSAHSRCPVLGGNMWCAVKKFFGTKLEKVEAVYGEKSDDRGGCSDEEESCPRWASQGECEKNVLYMIGSPDYYGACRKSCNAC